jgi:7-cyano-7-deazaguanine synthase
LLESQALYAIEEEGVSPETLQARVYLAPNAIDYSGYPDCRPEFFDRMQESLGYGSKLWTQYRVPLEIHTPIIELSKAEIVRWATELEAPLELTWSCYQGGDAPCGGCDSCVLRARGFAEAGCPDPALARLNRD